MSEDTQDENKEKNELGGSGDNFTRGKGKRPETNYLDKKRTLELLEALYSKTKAEDVKRYIEDLEKD
jgi:hypothetical protein